MQHMLDGGYSGSPPLVTAAFAVSGPPFLARHAVAQADAHQTHRHVMQNAASWPVRSPTHAAEAAGHVQMQGFAAANSGLLSQAYGGPAPDSEQRAAGGDGSPQEQRTLFFGRVPEHVKEAELSQLFSRCGPVTSLILFKQFPKSKYSKGCGLVEYASKLNAAAALQMLHGAHIWPDSPSPLNLQYMVPSKCQWGVRPNKSKAGAAARSGYAAPQLTPQQQAEKQQATLFFAAVPPRVIATELRALFSTCGEVVELLLFTRYPKCIPSKGCGVVEYRTKEQAQYALQSLNNNVLWPDSFKPMLLEPALSPNSRTERKAAAAAAAMTGTSEAAAGDYSLAQASLGAAGSPRVASGSGSAAQMAGEAAGEVPSAPRLDAAAAAAAGLLLVERGVPASPRGSSVTGRVTQSDPNTPVSSDSGRPAGASLEMLGGSAVVASRSEPLPATIGAPAAAAVVAGAVGGEATPTRQTAPAPRPTQTQLAAAALAAQQQLGGAVQTTFQLIRPLQGTPPLAPAAAPAPVQASAPALAYGPNVVFLPDQQQLGMPGGHWQPQYGAAQTAAMVAGPQLSPYAMVAPAQHAVQHMVPYPLMAYGQALHGTMGGGMMVQVPVMAGPMAPGTWQWAEAVSAGLSPGSACVDPGSAAMAAGAPLLMVNSGPPAQAALGYGGGDRASVTGVGELLAASAAAAADALAPALAAQLTMVPTGGIRAFPAVGTDACSGVQGSILHDHAGPAAAGWPAGASLPLSQGEARVTDAITQAVLRASGVAGSRQH